MITVGKLDGLTLFARGVRSRQHETMLQVVGELRMRKLCPCIYPS